MAYSKQTWVRGEKVASVKLNHMEDGIAAISANGAIDTENLANAAVTNNKLDQEAVDSDNIRTGAIITPLIYDGAVTLPKLGADVIAELDNKANIDGSYESMTVGNAEQLISSVGITDQTPYNFRTSGGSTEIGDREELNAVVGATVAWNQLVGTSFSSANGTLSQSGDVYSYTVTTVGSANYSNSAMQTDIQSIQQGHKVLLSAQVKPSKTKTIDVFLLRVTGTGNNPSLSKNCTAGVWNDVSGIVGVPTASGTTYGRMQMTFNDTSETGASVGDVEQFKNAMMFDLTQMFGSTIADYIYSLEQSSAGSGVAYFKKLFPKPYYAYNSGALLSVQTSAHKTVGFNQWDEEVESGYIDPTNGNETPDASKIRMKNYMPVLPNTVYYKKTGTNTDGQAQQFWNVYFDANKNYIGYGNPTAGVFTTPANCYFIRSGFEPNYGTTYKHDICINLHWDGERDGEYEPYEAHEYALDDITLRGILKLDASNNLYSDGDRYLPDGTVERRYGERAYQSGDESLSDAITDGTTTVYKLTTPTTETADPYQQTQIVDDFGTEEFVDAAVEANERDVAVPVGNITFYPQNLRKKIEGLPFDFSTLIARTEKAFKATKAYAVNEFLIINNQLYKTRTSIANGATITVGTNVIATTIGAELSAILNS